MDNVSPKEIIRAPGVLMFFTFINTLIYEGKAKFSDKYNKAVLLDSDSSNYFILGRDNKMSPYIGVQEEMVPWFFDLKWNYVAVCPNERYIYLVSEEKLETRFVLGLKPRLKRMITIFDPKKEKTEDLFLSLKVYKMLKKEIAVSNDSAISGLKIKYISSLDDILGDEDLSKETFDKKNNDNDGFTIARKI
jgi:hypothetical protein